MTYSHREYLREQYSERKRLGLCPRCGNDADRLPRVHCQSCISYISGKEKLRVFTTARHSTKSQAAGPQVSTEKGTNRGMGSRRDDSAVR